MWAIGCTDYQILDLSVVRVQEHSGIITSYGTDRTFNTLQFMFTVTGISHDNDDNDTKNNNDKNNDNHNQNNNDNNGKSNKNKTIYG